MPESLKSNLPNNILKTKCETIHDAREFYVIEPGRSIEIQF